MNKRAIFNWRRMSRIPAKRGVESVPVAGPLGPAPTPERPRPMPERPRPVPLRPRPHTREALEK